MKLIVQPKSETPIYEQLFNQIVSQIVCGQVPPHYCLPSLRLVAKELKISVIPVKTAYELLEKQGYIYTRQGKGCFVAEPNSNHKQHQQTLAQDKIAQTVQYLKNIGVSAQEATKMIEEEYKK